MSTLEAVQAPASASLRAEIDDAVRLPGTGPLLAFAAFGLCSAVAWGVAVGEQSTILAVVATILCAGALEVASRDVSGYHSAGAVRFVRHATGVIAATLAAAGIGAALQLDVAATRFAAAALGSVALVGLLEMLVLRHIAPPRPVRLLGVGTGRSASNLLCEFAQGDPGCFRLVGFVETNADAGEAALVGPVLGSLDDLDRIVADLRIDAVALCQPNGRLEVLERVLDLPGRPPRVLELSQVYERAFGRVPVEEINAAWFVRALSLRRRHVRYLTDRFVAAAMLLPLLPLFALVACLVKLDSPGPALYRQRRVGEGGRPFEILKFRSMRIDAEVNGAQWAAENDPRVTRLGRILRRYRLDELPQLWNVVRGDMAIVGPRPERPEFVQELARQLPFYEPRHLVRPGVTGWAQVYAPYGASAEDALVKLSYDLYYLNHGSLATDLGIMMRTARVMVGAVGSR